MKDEVMRTYRQRMNENIREAARWQKKLQAIETKLFTLRIERKELQRNIDLRAAALADKKRRTQERAEVMRKCGLTD